MTFVFLLAVQATGLQDDTCDRLLKEETPKSMAPEVNESHGWSVDKEGEFLS